MKVSELPYKRVTIEEIKAVMDDVLARTRNAKSVDEILAAREDYLKLLCDYRTAESLSYMRYSINTVDEFYVAEKDYYDEIGPEAENYMVQYASTLLDSPFRAELEERLSPVLFKHLEVSRKSMSPEIIDDLVEENKLVSEYSKLMASLEFEFRGESLPRAMLMKYATTARPAARHTKSSARCSRSTALSWTTSTTAWSTSATAWPRRWATRTTSSWATTAWGASTTIRTRSRLSARTC